MWDPDLGTLLMVEYFAMLMHLILPGPLLDGVKVLATGGFGTEVSLRNEYPIYSHLQGGRL